MSNELTSLNHDQLLQADLKAGKVTPEEVERIWELTRDLSAQAPINVRRAMISIRAAETPEEKVNLSMQFMMAAATELQAAMMRDESKFSHLVAGTETIVKTLQNINPLERRLDRIEDMVGGLGDMLSQLIKANVVPALMEHLKETDTCPNCGDLLPRTAKNGPCSCGNFQPAPELIDAFARFRFIATWSNGFRAPAMIMVQSHDSDRPAPNLIARAQKAFRDWAISEYAPAGLAPNEFVLTWEIAGKPPPRVSCICGREFADEAAFGVHVCNDKPGSAEELIPDEEQEAAEARRKSIGSAWSK